MERTPLRVYRPIQYVISETVPACSILDTVATCLQTTGVPSYVRRQDLTSRAKARKQNFHILCSHYLDWNWFYRDIQTWNRNFLVTASSLKQVLSGWLFWYVYLLPIRNNFIDERWMAILHICQHSALFLLFRDSFLSVAIWKWISPPGFSHTRLFHLGRMPLRSFHALPSPERSPGKEANNGSVRAELH